MNKYIQDQFNKIIDILFHPDNVGEVGGMSIVMENNDRFVVGKSLLSKINIFNSQTQKVDYSVDISNQRSKIGVTLFFYNKTNWIKHIKPLGKLPNQVFDDVTTQPVVLTNESAAIIRHHLYTNNKQIKNIIVSIEKLPFNHEFLHETYQKYNVTYYNSKIDSNKLSLELVLENFVCNNRIRFINNKF